LDDLPAGRNKKESRQVRLSRQPRFDLSNLIGNTKGVNQRVSFPVQLALERRGTAPPSPSWLSSQE